MQILGRTIFSVRRRAPRGARGLKFTEGREAQIGAAVVPLAGHVD